jgi:hypothetical protein
MEQAECFETSAYKIMTPGKHPKVKIPHSEHGESLKARIKDACFFFLFLYYIVFLLFFCVQFIASLLLPFFSSIVPDLVLSFVSITEHWFMRLTEFKFSNGRRIRVDGREVNCVLWEAMV